MGSVDVLVVGAHSHLLRPASWNTCIQTGSLVSHVPKGASLLFGLHRRCLAERLLIKKRLKRRRPHQNVRVRAQREGSSPHLSVLLAGDKGAPEGKPALIEVGPIEEEDVGDWISARPLHETFDEFVAARVQEKVLGLEGGSEECSSLTPAIQRAQETGSFSSLQREKKLENRKGLMGFEKVKPDASHSGASQDGSEPAGIRMQETSETVKEPSSVDETRPTESKESKTGGTQLIRPKEKEEAKQFESVLEQLPSSVPIPLWQFSVSANNVGKRTKKQEQGKGLEADEPSQKAAVNPSQKQTVKKSATSPAVRRVRRARLGQTPDAAAPRSRDEVAEKVSNFTSRLFRAMNASESHQDIWTIFQDPKPQAEKGAPAAKPDQTSPQSAEGPSTSLGEKQPTKADEGDMGAPPSLEQPVGPQQTEVESDACEGALKQDAVFARPVSAKEDKPIAEEETKTVSEDSRFGGESADDTTAAPQTPEGTESSSAEPFYPHWLVGPDGQNTLLVNGENLAAEGNWEGEGPPNQEKKPSHGRGSRLGVDSGLVDQGSQQRLRSEHSANGRRGAQQRAGALTDLRLATEEDDSVPKVRAGSSQSSSQGANQLRRNGNASISPAGTAVRGRPLRGLLRCMPLTSWEDPEAKPEAAPQIVLAYPDRPTFAEIVEGDKRMLRSALAYTRWWLRSWRVPLQSKYDPETVDHYFQKRPHLVLGRLFQIVSAFVVAGAPLLPELARVRLTKSADASRHQEESERRAAVQRAAQRFKRELVALGPTFIKAAQSLSSRPDIVGEDAAAVLAELQDRLPPFSSAEAMRVIEQELGRPAKEVFLELSKTPVAAASFGQVYKGRTRDGSAVAVKVQRPRVLASVALDIHILRALLQAVRKAARINSDLRLLADELGRGMYGELDYRAEAANAELFASSQDHLPFVSVPRVLHHYSARRILTMEWVEGDRPVDLLTAAAAQKSPVAGSSEAQFAQTQLLSLVSMGIESSLVQLLETGVMHSDPHPGNLLLQANGKLVYLDFGLMTHITCQHRDAMLAAIAHLVNAEWAALTDDLDALDVLKPANDRREVARALAEAFSGGPQPLITGAGVPRVRFGQVASKLWGIAIRFRFKLPPYFTLVLRNLASLEGIGLSVDPSFKVFASAYPHVVRKLLTENVPATRRVLQSLLADGEGGVRWDRLSLLASGFSEASGMSASVGQGSAPSLAARAARVALGRKGAGVRRVLLAMDLLRIARGFSSPSATPVRTLLAEAAASFVDQRLFGPRPDQSVLNSQQQDALLPSPISGGPSSQAASRDELADAKTVSAARFVVHDPSNRRGDKAVAPEVEARVVRKRAWLLLKLVTKRLPKNPIQRLTVFWVGLAFAFAIARGIAARAWSRLCVAAQGLVMQMQLGSSGEDRLRPMPSFI